MWCPLTPCLDPETALPSALQVSIPCRNPRGGDAPGTPDEIHAEPRAGHEQRHREHRRHDDRPADHPRPRIPARPPRIRRAVRYQVLTSEPPLLWETRGEMANGWLQIRYQLKMASNGTRFHRQLNFDVSGPLRLLRPLLTRRQRAVSAIALTQLKGVLESSADTGGRA